MTKEEFAQLLNSKADYSEQLQAIRAEAKHIGLVPALDEAQKRLNSLEKAHPITLKWHYERDYWRVETNLPHAKFIMKDFNGQPCGEGIVIDTKDLQ